MLPSEAPVARPPSTTFPAAEAEDDASRPDQLSQLRIASALALAGAILLLPLQAYAVTPAERPALFLIYGIHAALVCSVFVASWRTARVRRADALGLLFVLGLVANLLLYLYLLPFAVPTYPSLMSNALTSLLIAGA